MFKKIIVVCLFIVFYGRVAYAQNVIGDVELYIEELDRMTLDEARKFLRDEYDNFQQIKDWKEVFNIKCELSNIAKEDESYSTPFSILPAEEVLFQFNRYWDKLYLSQIYQYPQTKINIGSYSQVQLAGELDYSTNAIYYADGSIDSTYRSLKQWDILKTAKKIDSIRIVANYEYITACSSYKMNKDLNIEGGSIKIKELENNYVKLTFQGTAKNIKKVDALNAEGKVLSCISKVTGASEMWEKIDLYFGRFEKIRTMIDNFTSLEEIKNTLRKELGDLPSLDSEPVSQSFEGVYKGNISSLILYKVEETAQITKEQMLANSDGFSQDLICVYDNVKKMYGFMDKSGDWVIAPQYSELTKINDLYYSIWKDDIEDNEYYFLDTKEKQLTIIPDIQDMKKLNNTYVIALKEGKVALLGGDNQEVCPYIYDYISRIHGCDDLAIVGLGDERGIINLNGRFILPLGKNLVGSFSDGLINIRKSDEGDDNYEYINKEGKLLFSLEGYGDGGRFSNGRADVCQNGLYGFIDTYNNLIIPCKYEEVVTFVGEVTCVKYNGKYGLIDKDDNIIVPIEYNSSYQGFPGFGGITCGIIFYLDGDKYDSYGKKIE